MNDLAKVGDFQVCAGLNFKSIPNLAVGREWVQINVFFYSNSFYYNLKFSL